MDERPDSSQQLMDILLVMDEKGTLQAVSGVKDGELQTKNPLEDNNDLLRVDRHGDMFSNFFSNLWNQLKDPTRFHFFRVPEEEVQRVAADFRQRESQSVRRASRSLRSTRCSRPCRRSSRPKPGSSNSQRVRRSSPPGRPNRTRSTSTARRHRLEQPRRPRRAAGADRRQRDARPDAPGLPDRQDRPGAFPLRRHLAQQRQPALAQARHGRQADRVQPRHPRPGEDAEAVLRLRHHRLRQAGAPADGQHGTPGDCHQPGGRAGRSPCQPQSQDQRAGRLPALQGQYPGGEERAYLYPGRDSPAQTGRGGGLPVPFQSQGGGATQGLSGSRAVQRSQDAARISLRRPGQAGDGCVQGEPETDRQSGGAEDLPQAGAYREVPPRTRSRGNGQGLRLGGQERKSLPSYITWKPGEKPAFMFPKDYKAALEEGRVKPAVENEVQVAVNSEARPSRRPAT